VTTLNSRQATSPASSTLPPTFQSTAPQEQLPVALPRYTAADPALVCVIKGNDQSGLELQERSLTDEHFEATESSWQLCERLS